MAAPEGQTIWPTLSAALVGGLIGGALVFLWQRWNFRLLPGSLSYSDLAATMLGAVAVLLAILGFFIAVLALWGFAQFRHLVKKTATETATSHIDARLEDGDLRAHFEKLALQFLEMQFQSGHLRALVEERVDHIVYGGSTDRARDAGSGDDENSE